jgi:branched-chain amino acid transport system substrate-binding protein
MKRVLATFLSLAVILAVAGCGGTKSNSSSGGAAGSGKIKVKIATVTPLSGGQSSLGSAISNGAKLAVADRKADLEKAGYDVEVVPQDDQAEPTNGPIIANRLVGDKDVLGVVGTLNSGVAKTIAPVLKDANLAMVSPANTAIILTKSGYTSYNRIVASDAFQGAGAARATKNTLNAKTVYVLHDKTEYGQGLAAEYVKALKTLGITVANGDGEGINPKDSDFSAVVTKIMAAKPDVLFYGGIYDTASLLFKQADEKGFKGFFLGGDGLDDPTIVKNSGNAANRVYYTSVADNVYGADAGKSFVDRYKKLIGTGESPPTYAVYGYDAANVILESLIAYGTKNSGKVPSRDELAKAVRATKGFKGIAGDVTFDQNGDNPGAKVYLFQVKDSKYPGLALGEIKQ